MGIIVVRKNSKESWAKAVELPIRDTPERLQAWVDNGNDEAGFAKYKVVAA